MDNNFLYTDVTNIGNEIGTIETAILEIKPLFESFKKLNLGILDPNDIEKFINTPKTYFLDLLTKGESLKVGNLTLDPEKVYDLSPRPEGVDELVQRIIIKKDQDFSTRRILPYLQHITIVNNELAVNSIYRDKITKSFTYYADTPDKMRALKLITEIAEKTTELKSISKKLQYSDIDFRELIINQQSDYRTYKPNLKAIQSYF